jgi:hypothetical protein
VIGSWTDSKVLLSQLFEVRFPTNFHCALYLSSWHSITNDVDLLPPVVVCHVVNCQERLTTAEGHCWVADTHPVC